MFNNRLKRLNNRSYGVHLSASEQKAMEKEIKRQLIEMDRGNSKEIISIVLWILRDKFGFGEKRLKVVYDALQNDINRLISYYMMDEKDTEWLCTRKLKDSGIDISKWEEDNDVQTK